MANTFGTNPIILDTANDDSAYIAANDAKNGGAKYSTLRYKIKKIQIVGGANGDDIVINQCRTSDFTDTAIVTLKLETGDLQKQIDFGEGIWVDGICPATLDASCIVLVHL